MAAPLATTSSGLTPLCASLPASLSAVSTTLGMRVMPPTRTSSSMSDLERPASLRHASKGFTVFSMSGSVSCSSFERVSFTFKCLGPVASAVMNGRLMSVSCAEERAIFAFSDSSFRRWSAIGSLRRSMPFSFLKLSMSQSIIAASKLSPPSSVSPLVALTSNTPSPISRIEISYVPPPRS